MSIFFPRRRYSFTDAEHLTNAAYMIFYLMVGVVFFYAYDLAMKNTHGLFNGSLLSRWPVSCQAIALLFVLDFKEYWLHRGQHRFSFWWKFHKVHHSSRMLSVLADTRAQFFESYFVQALSNIIIAHALGATLEAYALFSLIVSVVFPWNHLNVDWPSGEAKWWHALFTSPNLHAIHHAVGEESFNYANIFPIWDCLFGTYKRLPLPRALEFGVIDAEYERLGFFEKELHPFKVLFSRCAAALKGAPAQAPGDSSGKTN